MNRINLIDKKILLYLLSAFLLIFSFPKWNYFPLAWISLVPVFFSFYFLKPQKAFFYGWILGIIFMTNILIWLYIFGWQPGVMGGLYYGIFWGIFTSLAAWFYQKTDSTECWKRIIFGAFVYVLAAEYLRTLSIFGVTWGDLSVSQYKFLPILQIVPLAGGFGLSCLIAFFNAYLAELIYQFINKRFTCHLSRVTIFTKLIFILLPPIILLICLGYGYLKLNFSKPPDYKSSLKISIIQPNINQDVKWDKKYLDSTLKTMKDLTFQAKKSNPDMIIWPETAVPDYLLYNRNLYKEISDLIKENQVYLLTGVPDAAWYKGKFYKYNSVFFFSPEGLLLDKYAKRHLVPFGEFIPVEEFFGRFKITQQVGDWTSGKRQVIFHLPEADFVALVCFESVFPYLARQACVNGAQFLVVVTNDAWFKRTTAAEHHLALSLLRGVENGVWIVQAANTGISAYITPEGKIIKASDLFTRVILTENIYLTNQRTLYNILGEWVIFLGFVITGILIIYVKFRMIP